MEEKSNFWKVVDFCHAFDHVVIDNMNQNPNLNQDTGNEYLRQNQKLSKLRYDLIYEEIMELTEAVNTNDIKEIIDALSDILYVVYGAGISFGINIDTHFKAYIKSHIIEKGNIFNSINFDNSNFELLRSISDAETKSATELLSIKKDIINSSINVLNTHLSSFNAAINENKYMNMIKPLVELTYTTYLIGLMLNIDLDKSFNIVHNSNMSKLCLTEEEAKRTVQNYIDNDDRYDTPAYKKGLFDNYYVIYNKSSGKILKSINYTPANFDSML